MRTPGQPQLAHFQRAISGALLRPLNCDESMQPANAAVAELFIKPNDHLSAFERLQIYNQQYWWRLPGALGEDFRGLRAVSGEDGFEKLAVAYIEACGSRSWTLRNLGSCLVAFLEKHSDHTRPRTELAIDAARVDWARVLAFDEPERPKLTARQIARTPPDRLRLQLQPYLNLLKLRYPVDHLTRMGISALGGSAHCTHDRHRETFAVSRARTPIYLAVHRVDFLVYYKRLAPEAFQLLLDIGSGVTLQEACSNTFGASPKSAKQNAARIREWFSTWAELGWLSLAAKN